MSFNKRYNLIFIFLYGILFLSGIKTLFHGFPDIERFFAEWMDERMVLTAIMKFGTLNFAPTEIVHPPLYYYLAFIPMAMFFVIGKIIGLFHDKIDFVRFYFNNTTYFFLIGRVISYIFYWLAALMIFRITRLFYDRLVGYITVLSYLLMPRFIFDFSTTRPEPLLFLNACIFFYFYLKYYLDNREAKYLFLSAFFLGVATATKYNAIYLGTLFVPLAFMQLKGRKYKDFLSLWIKAVFLVFLGFFICNPFFVIEFKKYFHNLLIYNSEEVRYYWKGYPAVFFVTHIKNLSSTLYLNLFGFIILMLGLYSLFKKDKTLYIFLCFSILVFESYFSIYLRDYSPLYFLNPLVPVSGFIFASGVDFIINKRRKLASILIIFGVVSAYNYFDIWKAISLRPTHLQKARTFIEKNIPEFTTICITSNSFLPQLNMTRESYYHLVKPAASLSSHKFSYKEMDDNNYSNAFKELRIESLTKSPKYNLIRWGEDIKREEDILSFIKMNNIKYILSRGPCKIGRVLIQNTGLASLLKVFEPNSKRMYDAVVGGGGVSVYLYNVNQDNLL